MPLKSCYYFIVCLVVIFCNFELSVNSQQQQNYYPILFWHSAGETCCGEEGKTYLEFLKREFNNQVIIKSVKIGKTKEDDFTLSLTIHPFEQINFVCNKLKDNPIYHNGYNALGFSQGALFFRALAQLCPFPPMINLISLGGPQQGANQFPRCEQRAGALVCKLFKFKVNLKVYETLNQRIIGPASYWHDENNEYTYRHRSTFLSIMNNELYRNETFIENLHRLRRLVLVKYKDDKSLIPNESAWFGYIYPNQTTRPFEDTDVYKEDKIGLRRMINEGRLIRMTSPLQHLALEKRWFRKYIIPILSEF